MSGSLCDAMVSHLVVDGSNIATEGRKVPSLQQLEEAVADFVAERPADNVVVVVDATFPNRIEKSEVARFEKLLDQGWLLTPPAGAVGRGDAFILQVAARVDANVLSNDSFQEFHGSASWLFDDGRLAGGKPVPGIGWVFVDRSPVRGPTSRRAVRDAKQTSSDSDAKPTSDASESSAGKAPAKRRRTRRPAKESSTETEASAAKQSEPKAAADSTKPTPDGVRRRVRRPASEAVTADDGAGQAPAEPKAARPQKRRGAKSPKKPTMNEPAPFVGFVAQYLPGSRVSATVNRFVSHGAYANVGDVTCYVPNRLLADPPPRSAKQVLSLGADVEFVVDSIDSDSRGIDLGIPGIVGSPPIQTKTLADSSAKGNRPNRRRRGATVTEVTAGMAAKKKAPAKRAQAKKKSPARKAPAKKAPARKAPAKKAPAKKAPAKKAPARKAPAKKAPAKKAAARRRRR